MKKETKQLIEALKNDEPLKAYINNVALICETANKDGFKQIALIENGRLQYVLTTWFDTQYCIHQITPFNGYITASFVKRLEDVYNRLNKKLESAE